MTDTMRAVAAAKYGDADVLCFQERPIPEIGEHDLLVEVKCAGINRADILQRRGHYPPPKGETDILGLEIAGTVTARGSSVKDFKVGDRVFGLVAGGGYAAYCRLDAGLAISLPDDWSFEQGAAVAEAFFTAGETLFQVGGLQPGEHVLIHAGGSGVGSAAIQLAKAIGAKVYTTVGSEEKAEQCRELGVDAAIVYKKQDFAESILALTNGRGVDQIIDFIGATYFQKHIDLLTTAGRLVLVGFLGGAKTNVNLFQILSKRLSIFGFIMRSRSKEDKIAIRNRFFQHHWPLLTSGKIRPVIHRSFHWEEVAAAHRYLEESNHFGKLVLNLNSPIRSVEVR